MALTEHWLTAPHWSSDIPLDTPHPRVSALDEHGYVVLRDADPIPESEYLELEYMDWKSGGDTNFAPVATADGELDCRGFWKPGEERPDKGGRFTSNAEHCPRIVAEVESVGADFGRVRVIKLEPQGYDDALRQIHRDDNNRFNPDADGWVVRSWIELTDNPDSFMILMEQGPDGLPDPDHRGAGPAPPRRALRRRHAAAVARRVPHRHRAALRARSPASRAVPRSKPGSLAALIRPLINSCP